MTIHQNSRKKSADISEKSDLENMVVKKETALYEALAKRFEEYGDKPEKAFKDGLKPASKWKTRPRRTFC